VRSCQPYRSMEGALRAIQFALGMAATKSTMAVKMEGELLEPIDRPGPLCGNRIPAEFHTGESAMLQFTLYDAQVLDRVSLNEVGIKIFKHKGEHGG
jgi:hypothetical protein